ncbi:Endoribonuclease L-PSP [Beutenbergia cavernae DSM 12333]|uniref:Endoribonuclease L-PSP n=1 Tax=Beutenbergia cavernae (strain ATCC BAA-8 / DSM 12333 / CCUG 43141 / JCM 11478 / NBRC 16432 / NCIMB 13614 / HKI 0122) TaxID=471853 RepID=C5BUY4_BEUC1|nr:RidA family protein [Beutenbergia cavernae]ACQ78358.1 Endoribonuclease L-PSP [Beutenbergia cavernae DSM 12333]
MSEQTSTAADAAPSSGAKVAILTSDAPPPAHTFSQGVRKGPILQVSGQGPVDAATGAYRHPGDVAAQTTLTLRNVKAIVEAGGASFADVVMLRVYLRHEGDFASMNEAYGAFVAEHAGEVLPSRTTVFTGLPRPEMLVEIDALAVVD